jgi:hypothetical protein
MISLPQTMPKIEAWYTDIGHLVRVLAIFAGLLVILLALILFIFGIAPLSLFTIARETLSMLFIGLSAGLLLITMMAIVKMRDPGLGRGRKAAWFQIGLHAANGIATVALTFTLFGISAGINQLAGGKLDINSINAVVTSLTSQFSMAFLTSVIGLPLSAFMRVVVVVTGKRNGF